MRAERASARLPEPLHEAVGRVPSRGNARSGRAPRPGSTVAIRGAGVTPVTPASRTTGPGLRRCYPRNTRAGSGVSSPVPHSANGNGPPFPEPHPPRKWHTADRFLSQRFEKSRTEAVRRWYGAEGRAPLRPPSPSYSPTGCALRNVPLPSRTCFKAGVGNGSIGFCRSGCARQPFRVGHSPTYKRRLFRTAPA